MAFAFFFAAAAAYTGLADGLIGLTRGQDYTNAVNTGRVDSNGAGPRVLVTGATGRTGAILYQLLKADGRVAEVRALVRNLTKAREVLGCVRCDASEGIYVGDVTNLSSLLVPARGIDTLAIAAAVGFHASEEVMKAVEFLGVENQAAALAAGRRAGVALSSLRVLLVSSAGTTVPNPPPYTGGKILFWKLNAEAALGYSGMGAVVIKPCGLVDGPAGAAPLGTGFDDNLPSAEFTVSRADVAAVLAEAIVERAAGLRFALCNGKKGSAPTTDLAALLKGARRPWAQ